MTPYLLFLLPLFLILILERFRFDPNLIPEGFRLQCLSQERFRRTVLVSDHTQWNARQIVETYRSLSVVQDAFKNMKNTDSLLWQPAHHWTDQKLGVRSLYCVLALLVSSLVRPKDQITLNRMSARQKKLDQALEIGEILGQKGEYAPSYLTI